MVNSLKEIEWESEKKEKYKKDYEGIFGFIVSRILVKYKFSLVGNFYYFLLVLVRIKFEYGLKEKVNIREKVYYWLFLLNWNVFFYGLEFCVKYFKWFFDVLYFGKDVF